MKGHIRARGPGSWELKFDGEPDPVTGARKTRYATVRGNKKDAQLELHRLLTQIGDGSFIEPAKVTVSEYLETWLSVHQHRISAKTFQRYREIVRKHLIPALGAHRLTKLGALHIQAYYGKALTTPRKRTKRGGDVDELAPLSAQTIQHHHRILSEALKQAVRLRVIARNPAADVDPPRPVRREMNILDQEQTAKLLKAAEGSAIYIVILIAVTTGMRRGEVLALRWRDIDLTARSLSVTQTLEETHDDAGHALPLAFKAPKTDRSRRSISLPALTVEALERHHIRQNEGRLKAGPAYDDQGLVCCDALGGLTRPHYVTQAFAKLSAKLGLGVRFHDLRHTHISHLLAAGVHPKVVSERAGHASVAITLDVYSHVIPGMQEDAANKIDAALRTHLER